MANNQEVLFTPSDAEIKQIADEVHKIMMNEFNTIAGVTWKSLTESAKFLIQRYNQLQSFSITLSQFDILRDAMGLVKKSDQYQVLIQASYAYAFWFDEQLKKFRGQVPSSALFVLDSKKYGVSTYELPMVSLIKYLNVADKSRLNASHASLQKELDGVKKEDIFNEEHVKHARAAYEGASNRLEQFWKKVGGQRQDGILLWKEKHAWMAGKVLNKGDLREAYAAALMTKHKSNLDKLCGIPTGSPQFYSHDLVKVFFHEHIEKVSNAAAIQEEDIVMSDKQYGVKSFRAELPSLSQYVEAAKWIVAQKEYSQKALEQELHKGGEVFRNRFLGELNSQSNEITDELLEEAFSIREKNKI